MLDLSSCRSAVSDWLLETECGGTIPNAMYSSFLSSGIFGCLSLIAHILLVSESINHVSASAVQKRYTVLEKREYSGPWTKQSRVPANTVIPVRIALAQSNLADGEDHLMRVYEYP